MKPNLLLVSNVSFFYTVRIFLYNYSHKVKKSKNLLWTQEHSLRSTRPYLAQVYVVIISTCLFLPFLLPLTEDHNSLNTTGLAVYIITFDHKSGKKSRNPSAGIAHVTVVNDSPLKQTPHLQHCTLSPKLQIYTDNKDLKDCLTEANIEHHHYPPLNV